MKNLKNKFSVFFIGVGGAGMSVLAKMLILKGFSVSGSDIKLNENVTELVNLGLKFFNGHSLKNVLDADVVVYSSAIPQNNPELMHAKKLKKAVYSRAELLNMLLAAYRFSVGIAGSHGKTTTTCMIACALNYLKLNSLCLMGGNCNSYGNLTYSNTAKIAVSEICEYNRNISKIKVDYPLVLNVDNDHLDTYGNINALQNEFLTFLKKGKIAFINADNEFLCDYKGKKVTFGIDKKANFTAQNLKQVNGKYIFTACENGKPIADINLNIYGKHNVYNALAAISILRKVCKVKPALLKGAIESFCGVKRRFENVNCIENKNVIFDYCHHPSEIKETIKIANDLFDKDVLFIFEPHTYSRTLELFDDFINTFKGQNLILYKTFAAREKYLKKGSAKTLATALNAPYFDNLKELKRKIETANESNVIIMGAGELYEKLTIKKDR